MAAKGIILFLLPFNQPPLKGGNAHYQFKDDLQDIKIDKKVSLSNLNSVYHTRTMNVWFENESLLRYGVNY